MGLALVVGVAATARTAFGADARRRRRGLDAAPLFLAAADRPDVLNALLFLVAMRCALRCATTGRIDAKLLLVALGLAAATKTSALPIGAAFVVTLLLVPSTRRALIGGPEQRRGFFVGVIAAAALAAPPWRAIVLLLVLTATTLVPWLRTHALPRYDPVLWLALALAAGLVIGRLAATRFVVLLVPLVVALALVNASWSLRAGEALLRGPMRTLAGADDRDVAITRALDLLPAYRAALAATLRTPKGCVSLATGDARIAYLGAPAVLSEVHTQPTLVAVLEGVRGVDDVIARIRATGATHVLVDDRAAGLLAQRGWAVDVPLLAEVVRALPAVWRGERAVVLEVPGPVDGPCSLPEKRAPSLAPVLGVAVALAVALPVPVVVLATPAVVVAIVVTLVTDVAIVAIVSVVVDVHDARGPRSIVHDDRLVALAVDDLAVCRLVHDDDLRGGLVHDDDGRGRGRRADRHEDAIDVDDDGRDGHGHGPVGVGWSGSKAHRERDGGEHRGCVHVLKDARLPVWIQAGTSDRNTYRRLRRPSVPNPAHP